jgi:hypothetical protein
VDNAAWPTVSGCSKYEQAFCDNAIDGAVLPELTADDLKDLGIHLVEDRRKLLAAICGPAERYCSGTRHTGSRVHGRTPAADGEALSG